jgi:hypothetical protein
MGLMAERKRGPVKPPVLDMKASETGSKDSATAADEKPAAPAARPRADKPLMPIGVWSAALIGIAGGAVLGVVLVIVLAFTGLLPGSDRTNLVDLPARMVAAEESVSESLVGMRALNDRVVALQALNDRMTGLQADFDALAGEVGGLGDQLRAFEAEPAPETADLGPLEEHIARLSDRIEAIASGASPADADALAGVLGETRLDMDALGEQVNRLAADFAAREAALGSALAEIAAMRAEMPAADSGTITPDELLRLPLILSGFEAAISNGRPYATELTALGETLPGVSVPLPVAAAAETGLPRGERAALELSARVPEMLAAQPANPDAEWHQTALERLQALLAIRPAGETEGNTPGAVVSRLEAAVRRQDFAMAEALMALLPAAMQDAAGAVVDDIAALSAAQSFVTELREVALSGVAQSGDAGVAN